MTCDQEVGAAGSPDQSPSKPSVNTFKFPEPLTITLSGLLSPACVKTIYPLSTITSVGVYVTVKSTEAEASTTTEL